MMKKTVAKERHSDVRLSLGSSTSVVSLMGAFRIAATYLAFGSLWILLSDLAVDFLVKDAELRTAVSLAKGWVYVLVTAVLLAALIRGSLAKILEYDRQFVKRDETIRNANRELLRFRHNLDSLVRERTFKLESQTEEANSASRAKSDFLARVSHEIRNPLNAIVGLARLMEKTDLDPKQAEYCAMLTNSTKVLLGIINDVLDFAKIESGKLELCESPYSLQSLVGRVRSILYPLAEDKGLTVEISVDGSLPDRLVGDELRLGQVLLNLSMNAVKFTKRGFIRISIAPAHVPAPALASARERERVEGARWIRFSVADSGIGIPEDRIDRLFRAFSQADSSTAKEYGGTGLGLAISKALVETMGGTIGVASEEGVGSEFYFELPQRPATDANADGESTVGSRSRREAATDGPAEDAPPARSLPPASVLVVDDNEINLMILEECLRDSGLRIRAATGGREALALAAAERFDVILLDLHMPELDGIAVARAIRSRSDAGQPVIIALTADADSAVRECVLGAGMNDFITKPIDHDNLLVCLGYWLERVAGSSADAERDLT